MQAMLFKHLIKESMHISTSSDISILN